MTIDSSVAVLRVSPGGTTILVAGYFSADLAQLEGARKDKYIVTVLAKAGLEDMTAKLLPRRRPWCQYGRTGSMVLLGR